MGGSRTSTIEASWIVLVSVLVSLLMIGSIVLIQTDRELNARVDNQQGVLDCLVSMANQHDEEVRQMRNEVDVLIEYSNREAE